MNGGNAIDIADQARKEEVPDLRESALLKVKAVQEKRAEILHLSDSFGATEVDSTENSFVFQLTDRPDKLNEFIEAFEPYGIIELARTGITAIARGEEGF